MGDDSKFKLYICKAFYFFFFSSFMLRIIYTPVYFKQLGLSPFFVGIISGAIPFVRAIGGLCLCYVADKTKSRKTVFLVSLFFCVVTPLMVTLPQPGSTMCLKDESSDLMPVSTTYFNTKLGSTVTRNKDFTNESKPTFDVLTLNQSQESRNRTPEERFGKKRLFKFHLTSFPSISSQLAKNDSTPKVKEDEVPKLVKYFFGVLGYDNRTDSKSERMANDNDNSLAKENIHRTLISGFSGKFPKKKLRDDQFLNATAEEEKHSKMTMNESKEMTQLFAWLLLISITGDFLSGPSRNLADTATMFVLEGDKTRYGTVRLWSNLGQIVVISCISFVVYLMKTNVCGRLYDNYKISLYTLSAGMGVSLLIGTQFQFTLPEEKKETENPPSEPKAKELLKDVIALVKTSWNLLIIVVFFGSFESVFSTFMFWYVLILGTPDATIIIGAANLLRNVFGLFTFMVSPYFIRKAGTINTVNLGILLYGVSFLSYSYISNPWPTIIPEVIQNIAFAFTMSSCIYFFSETATENIASTAQGLLQLMRAVGLSIGPAVSGFIIDKVGLPITFRIFAGLSMCLLVYSVAVQVATKYKDSNNQKYKPIRAQEEDFESSN